MTPGQPVTPRYQLLMGPWQHVTTGTGVNISALELEWFDTWLLGERTPLPRRRRRCISTSATPGRARWVDAAQWPLPDGDAHLVLLRRRAERQRPVSQNDGTLTLTAPTPRIGLGHGHLWTGVTSPCDIQTDQWGAGAAGARVPVVRHERPLRPQRRHVGRRAGRPRSTPSAPFTSPEVVAGPIDATVYLTSNTADTELAATVEAVSPGGDSLPMSSGALLGSLRALDPARTWTVAGRRLLLPVHPLTQDVAAAGRARPGDTREDIAVFPTMTELPAGWRLRVTLTTADTPHLFPTATQLPKPVGGIYQVQRSAGGRVHADRAGRAGLRLRRTRAASICSPAGP